jgi:2'-5' RNA ligase
MAHEVQKWMRRLLLFVCVLDGLSLAPSHPSHARPHASWPSRRGIASACFAPCGLLPCSPMSGQGIKLCVHPVLRRAECLVGGRRRCWATFQRGADSGTRRASHLRMVMPGSSGFEEAEDVAERLFRLKTAVQSREDEFDGSKKSADEAAGDEIGEKIVVDIDLERPLGFTLKEVAGYGIYVDYVDMGGSAQMRGVQRGDRVLATSATLGGSMWEKSTMAGVLSALHSGTLFSNTVRIRFERDPVLASIVGFSAESSTSRVDLARALISVERARLRIQQSTIENFEVALPLPGKNKAFLKGENPFNGQLPYGMLLAQDEQGVFVADISPEGTAADSGLLRIGDRIVATQGSIGTQLWPKKTLDGILSAVTTRMGNSITLKIERKVQLGSWEQRSVRVIPASPLDKVAYYSTSGAGISIRKNATIAAETSVLEVEAGGGKGVRKARRSTLSSSLVLLPDEKGWDMVQEVRLSHDRKVRMWPPHITLLRPFVRVEDFPAAAELLDEILNDFPPMKLQFEMRVIKHHDYCTSLWLVPADESRDKIAELQQSVQAVFPQCKRSKYLLRLLNKNRYLPHMTLGQFTTEAEASVLKALYEEKFSTVTFSVNHLFLLSRPDRTGPVEQMRVRLGPSTSESQGLSSAVSEVCFYLLSVRVCV